MSWFQGRSEKVKTRSPFMESLVATLTSNINSDKQSAATTGESFRDTLAVRYLRDGMRHFYGRPTKGWKAQVKE